MGNLQAKYCKILSYNTNTIYTHTHTHVNKIDFMSIWLTNSSLKKKFIKSNQSRKNRVKEIQIKGNKIHLTRNQSFSFSFLIIASDFRRKYS